MLFKYKEREVNKTLKTVFLHITDELPCSGPRVPCATTFSLRASGLGPGSTLGEKGEKNRPAKRAERRLLRSPILFLFDLVFCLFALFPPTTEPGPRLRAPGDHLKTSRPERWTCTKSTLGSSYAALWFICRTAAGNTA